MAIPKRKLPKHIYKRRRLAFTSIVTLLVVAIILTFVGFKKPKEAVAPEQANASEPASGNKRILDEEAPALDDTKDKEPSEPLDPEGSDAIDNTKDTIGSLEAEPTELQDVLSTTDGIVDKEAEPDVAPLSATPDESPNKAPTSESKEVVEEILDWRTLLVNNKSVLSKDFTIKTVKVGGHKVDSRIERELVKMIMAAKASGVNLQIVSGYRSVEDQQQVYNKKIEEYRTSGYSDAKGKEYTEMYISIPGYSEHHTGLAVDIMTPSYTKMNVGYANTAAAKWLKENAAEYGFILRYPEGKEKVTGIAFEPWHYRFVGVSTAKDIMGKGITLEEYFYLQQKQIETETKAQDTTKTDDKIS